MSALPAKPKAVSEAYRAPPIAPDNRDLVRNCDRPMIEGINRLCDDAETNPTGGISLRLCVSVSGRSDEVATAGLETALIPIGGSGVILLGDQRVPFSRDNWREQSCLVVHAPGGTPLRIEGSRSEVAIIQTRNPSPFQPRVFQPSEIASERRGEGFADNTALRIVRTAFDHTNKPAASKLTLGEVVNLPGKWSSYPGHLHPQPEWYLYKFDQPGGYGVGRNGDHPYDVQENDVLRIHPNHRHEQVAAPNFWMYYIWAVRDLPEEVYTGFTYQDQRHVDAFWRGSDLLSAEK